ncbi:pah4 homeobox protein encoded by the pah4 protein [Podospora fimiseda]|uniref:Pah4 homeobox protein encoded by the pah4 protein n=1 Tax=Podospora fimiseda TaxID=252190 RepID=A0AAN7BY15_9PEZI|nr:pah4 homeobox protein encoded by the pah4 protein [Podospora fimiseda]
MMENEAPSPPLRDSSLPPPSIPSSPSPVPSQTAQEQRPSSPINYSNALPTPNASQSSPEFRSELSRSAMEGEGERHPKGKRKRTAAKDKSILEAAYNANPKPDKAARLEIVRRVSLNEKEVQIWFQNRRQNDRRKARPLSPQEIAALRYGGMQIISSDPAAYNTSFSSDNSSTSPVQAIILRPEPESTSPLRSDIAPPFPSDEPEKAAEMPCESRPVEETQARKQEAVAATPAPKERGIETPHHSLSQSFSGSVGYLSNRWNPSSSFATPVNLGRDESFSIEEFSSSCPPNFAAGSILPPPTSSQTSRFRLSMSLEGKAEVVSAIPSPPQSIAPAPTREMLHSIGPMRRPDWQRSHSASPSITLPPISELTKSLTNPSPLPPRLTRGRSRDPHAWEFCCDVENREDALTVQAKHESSGSAVAAISLLRSTSATNSSPLQPSNSAKRNTTMSKAAPRPGMAKKPKLGRSSSSVARLQSSMNGSEKVKSKSGVPHSTSGNDSDKENWSPYEGGNARYPPRTPMYSYFQPLTASGRRPLPSFSSSSSRLDKKNPRRTPANGRSFLGNTGRANTAPVGKFGIYKKRVGVNESSLNIYEDDDREQQTSPLSDEVERFMMGQVSPSKKGDVDAVAGLLSLSQGNWR